MLALNTTDNYIAAEVGKPASQCSERSIKRPIHNEKMLEKLDFHLPVIRCFAFKVLQRQKKILLRNSLFLEAKQVEDLALLLCSALLKANVLNPSLFSGFTVLSSALHCLPSLLVFFVFFFFSPLFPTHHVSSTF